jgi:hypothetical protein
LFLPLFSSGKMEETLAANWLEVFREADLREALLFGAWMTVLTCFWLAIFLVPATGAGWILQAFVTIAITHWSRRTRAQPESNRAIVSKT